MAAGFPVLVITGPRQSGKTTLARACFPDKPYVSLENLNERTFAAEDAQGFLARFPAGAILDEVQQVPSLLSYLQTRVDAAQRMGEFVLTGSQNFGLMANISQSLRTWQRYAGEEAGKPALIYAGPEAYLRSGIAVVPWKKAVPSGSS